MITIIPEGTIVRYKYKGEYQYAIVRKMPDTHCLELISQSEVPVGTNVVNCKWGKNEELIRITTCQ